MIGHRKCVYACYKVSVQLNVSAAYRRSLISVCGVYVCSSALECTSVLISVCVCFCLCVSFSSSWPACLLMFGHMLSFISLRHQSCWPAVRTAALSVPLLLYSLRQWLALNLSLSFFLSVCFCQSASLLFLFSFTIAIFPSFLSLFLLVSALFIFLSFQLLSILFFLSFLSLMLWGLQLKSHH